MTLAAYEPVLKPAKSGGLTGHPRLIASLAEGLNEYADQAAERVTLLSHRPSSPIWWFANLAISCGAVHWGEKETAQLSERTLWLLELLAIADFAADDLWCTCHLEALSFMRPDLTVAPIWWKDRYYQPCWPCLFGAHDRCSDHLCGGRSGEINFPEVHMRAAA